MAKHNVKDCLVFSIALFNAVFPHWVACGFLWEAPILHNPTPGPYDLTHDNNWIAEESGHANHGNKMLPFLESSCGPQAEDYGIIGSAEFEEYERWFHLHGLSYATIPGLSPLTAMAPSERLILGNQPTDQHMSNSLGGNNMEKLAKPDGRRCEASLLPVQGAGITAQSVRSTKNHFEAGGNDVACLKEPNRRRKSILSPVTLEGPSKKVPKTVNPPEVLSEEFIVKLFGWTSTYDYPFIKKWKGDEFCIPVLASQKSWTKLTPTNEWSDLIQRFQGSIVKSKTIGKQDAFRHAKMLLTDIFYRNAQFLAFFSSPSFKPELCKTETTRFKLSAEEQQNLFKWLSEQFKSTPETSSKDKPEDLNSVTFSSSSSAALLSAYIQTTTDINLMGGWETSKMWKGSRTHKVSYHEALKQKFLFEVLENYYKTTNPEKWKAYFSTDLKIVKIFALLKLKRYNRNSHVISKVLDLWAKMEILPWQEKKLKQEFEGNIIREEVYQLLNNIDLKSQIDNNFSESKKSSSENPALELQQKNHKKHSKLATNDQSESDDTMASFY